MIIARPLRSPLRKAVASSLALVGGAPAAAVPFAVALPYTVRFHEENPSTLATVTWTIVPPTPGNSLVVCFKPTLGESVVLSFTDNLANVWSHDQVGGNGHFFSLSQCPNAPTTLSVTVDTLIGCRLYGVELEGCPSGIEFVSGGDSSYAGQTGQLFSYTTAQADSFAMSVVNTSPSRTPAANVGSTLERLMVDGAGDPYSGPVSEHSIHKIFPTAGAVNMGSTWTAEGACSGTSSHALYRKAA